MPFTFKLTEIEEAVAQGLNLVAKLAPLAALGGPAAAAIGATVGSVATTASELLAAVEGDAEIIASGDLTKIREMVAVIQAENKQLVGRMAAS